MTIKVHRFSNRIALTFGRGETMYLAVDDARDLANALNSAVKSVMTRDTVNHGFAPVNIDATAYRLVFNGEGDSHANKPSCVTVTWEGETPNVYRFATPFERNAFKTGLELGIGYFSDPELSDF